MDKITFLELIEILRPMKSPDTNSPNYRSLSTEKKIAEKISLNIQAICNAKGMARVGS